MPSNRCMTPDAIRVITSGMRGGMSFLCNPWWPVSAKCTAKRLALDAIKAQPFFRGGKQ